MCDFNSTATKGCHAFENILSRTGIPTYRLSKKNGAEKAILLSVHVTCTDTLNIGSLKFFYQSEIPLFEREILLSNLEIENVKFP